MDLFSRRRWATGLAQQSNNYGNMPCTCCLIFWGLKQTQQLFVWAVPAFISFYWRAPWPGYSSIWLQFSHRHGKKSAEWKEAIASLKYYNLKNDSTQLKFSRIFLLPANLLRSPGLMVSFMRWKSPFRYWAALRVTPRSLPSRSWKEGISDYISGISLL